MQADIESFLRKVPFFRLVLFFLLGILFQNYIGFNFYICAGIAFSGMSFILFSFLIKKTDILFQKRWLFGFGVFLFLFACGMFLTAQKNKQTTLPVSAGEQSYYCQLISKPVEKNKTVLCEVKMLKNISTDEKSAYKAILYLHKDSSSLHLQYGDYLLIHAKISKPENLGNPDEFNYADYLKYKGIAGTAYIPTDNWNKTEENKSFSMYAFSQQCRDKLLEKYKNTGIAGDELAILSALTLGYKEDLSADLKENFRASGVMHILAVSGLHVGFIYLVLSFIVGFRKPAKKMRVPKGLFIISALWFYAFITGLSPSVVRAVVMLSFYLFAVIINHRSQIYNTIFLSAFVMLVYNPYYLFDVGFQLSYSAVLSIVFIQSKTDQLLPVKNRFLNKVWTLFTVSVAAQLGTAPFVLYYFHQFPNYFWLANIFIVPLASFIIYMALVLLLLGWIPYLGGLVVWIMNSLLKFFNLIVLQISRLPYAVSDGIWLESYQVLFLYLLLFMFVLAFMYKDRKILIGCISVVLFLLVLHVKRTHEFVLSKQIVVTAMQKGYAVSFIDNKKHYLLSDNGIEAKQRMKNYWIKSRAKEPDLTSANGLITFEKKSVLILTDTFSLPAAPLKTDYLILACHVKIPFSELLKSVQPQKVIVNRNYPARKTEQLKTICKSHNIDVHVIAEQGVFIELLR